MRRFSTMSAIPTIVFPALDYEEMKAEYPDVEEMTDGNAVGFFNALGYFYMRWNK